LRFEHVKAKYPYPMQLVLDAMRENTHLAGRLRLPEAACFMPESRGDRPRVGRMKPRAWGTG
jgi:hypothetical protein